MLFPRFRAQASLKELILVQERFAAHDKPCGRFMTTRSVES